MSGDRAQMRQSDARELRPGQSGTPSARDERAGVGRFLGFVEHITRGPVSVVVTVVFFVGAGVLGGRAGIAVSSGWVAVLAAYCLANFWRCREAHCIVTGTGWAAASLLGFAAAVVPGSALSWYVPGVQAGMFLAILGLGYGWECSVRARTGDRDRFLR